METINITKKRFESLTPYDLPNYVYNTEGTLYVLPIKNRWTTYLIMSITRKVHYMFYQ